MKTGAEVVCVDERGKALGENVLDTPVYEGVDLVVKSPGIASTHAWVVEAKKRNINVIGEIELAAQQLKEKIVIGITGSNGKTSTTLFTTHLLQSCGFSAVAAGNVGVPLISVVDDRAEILVVELSSFQLEDVQTPFLDSAVILNITPNHLDRYSSFEQYVEAKFRMQSCLKVGGTFYLAEEIINNFGNFLMPYWKEKVETIFPLGYRDGKSGISTHEFENICVAFTLCQRFGIDEASVWEAVATFAKPPHRLEFVCQISGVSFINDSKATSVDALRKAIEAMQMPVVLIAGGVDKGGKFKELGSLFKKKVLKIFAIGEAAGRIQKELSTAVDVEKSSSLEKAVRDAFREAEKGDAILLSPACSSFDQFPNYEQRGVAFLEIVEKLKEEKQ